MRGAGRSAVRHDETPGKGPLISMMTMESTPSGIQAFGIKAAWSRVSGWSWVVTDLKSGEHVEVGVMFPGRKPTVVHMIASATEIQEVLE
jgi:hypothetical protein